MPFCPYAINSIGSCVVSPRQREAKRANPTRSPSCVDAFYLHYANIISELCTSIGLLLVRLRVRKGLLLISSLPELLLAVQKTSVDALLHLGMVHLKQ